MRGAAGGGQPALRSYFTKERGATLSFFDEPDQPAARARPGRRTPPAGPPTDRQTLMVRRAVADRGRNSRAAAPRARLPRLPRRPQGARAEGLRPRRGRPGPGVRPGGRGPVRAAARPRRRQRRGHREPAEHLPQPGRASWWTAPPGIDHPSDVDAAHAYLVEVFEFRRDGVAQIAEQLPERDRRPGRPPRRHRADRRRDAELPHQRRALPDPLHAEAQRRAQGGGRRREGAAEQLPARRRVAPADGGGRSRAQPRRERRRRGRRARPARQRARGRHARRPGARRRAARPASGWPTT